VFNASLLLIAPAGEARDALAKLLTNRGYRLRACFGQLHEAESLAYAPHLLVVEESLRASTQGFKNKVQQAVPLCFFCLNHVLQDPVALFVELEILARTQSEELRIGEARVRQLLEHLADILVILNADGSPRYLSPSLERITGYRPEELSSKGPLEVVHPEDQAKVRQAIFWSHEHPGLPIMFEYRHIHKQGGYVHLESVGQSLLDVPGISAFVVVSRDISARRGWEAKIQDSEQRYRVVAEQTGQMVYDWDVLSGEIQWVGAIEKITGFESEAYQDVNIEVWESMIHEQERAQTLAVLDQAAHADGHFCMEYRLRRRDGSYVWVEDTGLFLKDEEGLAVRMLGSMKDISQRRMQAELLQNAVHERELLLQEIHHRVKNNFQIMISLLNMQMRRLPRAEVLEPLRDVRNRLHSMLLVHEELYRQGFSGRVPFRECLEILCRELYLQYAERGSIQILEELEPLSLSMDQAIPCGLIVNELLTNAFKYAFSAEQRDARIQISLRSLDECVFLEINDNGVGLPDDYSSGLGLHLVERLAHQLEGQCRRLPLSQGTAWHLSFPRA